MNTDKDKKANTPPAGYWTVNTEHYSKSERAIILTLKVIGAILLFPIVVFIVASQFAPDESNSSSEPRKDDPFGNFSMSLNGQD